MVYSTNDKKKRAVRYDCAVGFHNAFRTLYLQAYIICTGRSVCFYNTFFCPKGAINGWFLRNKRVVFKGTGVGQEKARYYSIQDEAKDATDVFFHRFGANTFFVRYLKRFFKTERIGWYVKKKTAFSFFEVLCGLYLAKKNACDDVILLLDTPDNRFITEWFQNKEKTVLNLRWLSPLPVLLCQIMAYYAFVLKSLVTRGVTIKKFESAKLYKEAVWGISRPTMRDDAVVDGMNFRKEDVFFYSRYYDEARQRSSREIIKAGYRLVDINKCPVNIAFRTIDFIRIFFVQPFILFLSSIVRKDERFIEHTRFYRDIFSHYAFLSTHDVKCHIASIDYDEVAETIIMNWFGTKNVLYQWSDWTSGRDVFNSFTAFNNYYVWGFIHGRAQESNCFCDKEEEVGCIFLKTYFDSLRKRCSRGSASVVKNILLCDSGFSNAIFGTESAYLDFLDLAINLLEECKDTKVVFKLKLPLRDVEIRFIDEENRLLYKRKVERLVADSRFTFVDPYQSQSEPLMAEADIVITMGIGSSSSIALMGRKEAIYYDKAGNSKHPMCLYKNKVVFTDSGRLIDFVKDVLGGRESVFSYIDGDVLKRYDPFGDGMALERLTASLAKECLPMAAHL